MARWGGITLGPASRVTPELQAEVRANRWELIRFLDPQYVEQVEAAAGRCSPWDREDSDSPVEVVTIEGVVFGAGPEGWWDTWVESLRALGGSKKKPTKKPHSARKDLSWEKDE